MMRDDEEEMEVLRPPAYHEQYFDSKIEEDLGYEITDPVLKNQIAEEIYNPKPKAEFGFDPSVGGEPGKPLFTLTSYATNTGTLESEEDQPTNMVAASMGYVMSSKTSDAEKESLAQEVDDKFGRKTPQDLEEEDSSSSSSDESEKKKKKKKKKDKKKAKEESSPYKPNAQLDTLDEDSEYDGKVREPKRPPAKGIDRIHGKAFLHTFSLTAVILRSASNSYGMSQLLYGFVR